MQRENLIEHQAVLLHDPATGMLYRHLILETKLKEEAGKAIARATGSHFFNPAHELGGSALSFSPTIQSTQEEIFEAANSVARFYDVEIIPHTQFKGGSFKAYRKYLAKRAMGLTA